MKRLATLDSLPKLWHLPRWFLLVLSFCLRRGFFSFCMLDQVFQNTSFCPQSLQTVQCIVLRSLAWCFLRAEITNLGLVSLSFLFYECIPPVPELLSWLFNTFFSFRYPSVFCKLTQANGKHQLPFHACIYPDAPAMTTFWIVSWSLFHSPLDRLPICHMDLQIWCRLEGGQADTPK